MKLTNTLYKHNISRWIKRQWAVKGWQYKRHSYAKQILDENGIPYEKAIDFVKEPKQLVTFNYNRVFNPPKLRKDINHPDFKEQACYVFRDENLLVEGLDQAKILTKTVEIEEGLPKKILKLKQEAAQPGPIHEIVKKNLFSALVYDASQLKLPVRKDPQRPAYKFPRDYGIVDTRRNMLVCNKLLQLCESLSGGDVESKVLLDDAIFQLTLEKDEDILQFQLRGDKIITSTTPLDNFSNSTSAASGKELPIMHPLKCTISLEKNHFYQMSDYFPLHKGASHPFIHTALVHFNETEVKNAYATTVTESQILSRSLMKAFTMAACQAKYLYGNDVKDLPSPCNIQLIQTDAKSFHFCAFQLNTLDLVDSHNVRNVFWSHPLIDVSSGWGYDTGKPFFDGYNPHVFDLLYAFYLNGSQTAKTSMKATA